METMTKMLQSRLGEVKPRWMWEQEIDSFWAYAEKQNQHICSSSVSTNKRAFKRPADAFERYARILGLTEYKGFN